MAGGDGRVESHGPYLGNGVSHHLLLVGIQLRDTGDFDRLAGANAFDDRLGHVCLHQPVGLGLDHAGDHPVTDPAEPPGRP